MFKLLQPLPAGNLMHTYSLYLDFLEIITDVTHMFYHLIYHVTSYACHVIFHVTSYVMPPRMPQNMLCHRVSNTEMSLTAAMNK